MLNVKYQQGSVEALKAGIIWREKLDYGKILINFLSIWVAAQFVLQIFFHPGFILGFGCIYALIIGIKAGGNEVSDGAEEFNFSLAAPRSVRFKVKYTYGLKPLLLILTLGLLTIYFNLSQLFWGLFVETGLNNPYAGEKAKLFWYILSSMLPVCLYTIIFTVSICTYGRNYLNRAVFAGVFISGLAVIAIAILYHYSGALVTNILTILILGLITAISISVSFKTYCFKEGMSLSRPEGKRKSTVYIVTAIILVIFFLFVFLYGSVRPVKSPAITPPSPVKTIENQR